MRQSSLFTAALFFAGLAVAHAQSGAPATGPLPPDLDTDVPAPPHAYQGGVGSRFSPRASNIEGADTFSEQAPRLPDPAAAGDGPRAYLEAAQRALQRYQTGAAQEALERAQTRILSRSTDPALANTPDDRGLTRAINDARLALGKHDIRRAQAILAQVLAPRH